MCGFRHHTIHAVYLKSAMQRLEQGDVVTETQLARLKAWLCAMGKD